MPAAAVIPAPIAYTKVVAVKKLVAGSRVFTGTAGPPRGGVPLAVLGPPSQSLLAMLLSESLREGR